MILLLYLLISISIYLPSTISVPLNSCTIGQQTAIYDYIIIGSGPGGATIATRLALNDYKVLLIEAGPDYDDIITETPVFWPEVQLEPQITAQFNPYLYSKEDNRTIQYPRGIALGGSTLINAMIIMTPNPSEWDDIANTTNDTNWSYENIKRKYQPLVENCEYCANNDTYANKNGWLNISRSTTGFVESPLLTKNPVLTELLKAVSSEVPYNPDVDKNNTYDSYYFTPKSVSQDTGHRSDTYRRIKDVQASKTLNLDVWTNTFVTKIIIDNGTKEACGVEYVIGAFLYKASPLEPLNPIKNDLVKLSIFAKREIIVSGGQWMSPQLLQLSGIGNKTLLEKFNISVIQDLPGVGQNQHDRNEMPYIVKLKVNPNFPGPIDPACILGGILNSSCLINSTINAPEDFLSSNAILFSILRSAAPIKANFPDSALYFAPLRFTGFRKNWVIKAAPYTIGPYITVIINYARVKNNLGTVEIKSANPFDTPLIQLRHFEGPDGQTEVNQIMDHIRFLRKIFIQSNFSQYVEFEELPGSNVASDEDLSDYIHKEVWGHHACCTNKMGDTENDPLAVVNSKGQVKGVKNLRIADISIWREMPGYFPFLPVSIACEKIANDIIQLART
ncbi:unnamed protein product [Adineta steineri]|uniref:Uncharacterized protein n=3 Tax=Adineta steineri TaxID=433720 RepID=A0A815B896_9BILA|nr:unnamed protein product [Adineta steineri]